MAQHDARYGHVGSVGVEFFGGWIELSIDEAYQLLRSEPYNTQLLNAIHQAEDEDWIVED